MPAGRGDETESEEEALFNQLPHDDDADDDDWQQNAWDDGYEDARSDASAREDDDDDSKHVKDDRILVEWKVQSVTIGDLFERLKAGKINLNPSFQRNVVWTPVAQSLLIESIFNNEWVPPPVFNRVPSETTPPDVWRCLDGKQRMTSIRRFLNGDIPYVDPDTKMKLYFKRNPSMWRARNGAALLDARRQAVFLEKLLCVATYQGLTGRQERRLFIKIQEGVALENGEKLRAREGPWPEYCDSLMKRYVRRKDDGTGWENYLIKCTRDSEFAMVVAMVRLVKDLEDGLEPAMVAASSFLKAENPLGLQCPVPSSLRKRLEGILDRIEELSRIPASKVVTLAGKLKSTRHAHQAFLQPLTAKKVGCLMAPVELIWLVYIFDCHAHRRTNGELLEMIEMLKQILRDKHKSQVKQNNEVIKTIKAWCKSFKAADLTRKYERDAHPSRVALNINLESTKRSAPASRASSTTAAPKSKPTPKATAKTTASKRKASEIESPASHSQVEPPSSGSTLSRAAASSNSRAPPPPSSKATPSSSSVTGTAPTWSVPAKRSRWSSNTTSNPPPAPRNDQLEDYRPRVSPPPRLTVRPQSISTQQDNGGNSSRFSARNPQSPLMISSANSMSTSNSRSLPMTPSPLIHTSTLTQPYRDIKNGQTRAPPISTPYTTTNSKPLYPPPPPPPPPPPLPTATNASQQPFQRSIANSGQATLIYPTIHGLPSFRKARREPDQGQGDWNTTMDSIQER